MTKLLIKLFIKNCDNVKEASVRYSYGRLGGYIGILCNLFLSLIKIIIGSVTASISIIADGLNNLSDMGSSVVTIIGYKMASKPADSDHPFGHGRMEYMSAFIVAVLILIMGFELLKSSFLSLINGTPAPRYTYISLTVLIISILVKLWMYLFNRKLGKIIDSKPLLATAQDSLNDIAATFFILVSAIAEMLFSLPFNLDSIMGILVALFIIFSGVMTAKDTINQILGAPPEKEIIDEIKSTVLSFKEFIGLHDLIVHNYGPGRYFASVHVEVPQNTDIVKCHEQIDLCEKLVNERFGISLVIHMDPMDVNNERLREVRAEMEKVIKAIDPRLTLHDFRMTPSGESRTNLIFDTVVPDGLNIPLTELNAEIVRAAKQINPTYCCVITFDRDYA